MPQLGVFQVQFELFYLHLGCNTGKYSLAAKNKWGEDTAEFQLNVFGKPEPPRGPLKVSEVTKKTCFLEWGMPADNGGYQVN